MPSAEYDLRYVEAGLAAGKDYLLSQDLFGPLDAQPPAGELYYPRLTLGNLLLAMQRLRATCGSDRELERLRAVLAKKDEIRAQWRVAWERKAAWEFKARLNQWRNFIEEYRQEPEAHADRYGVESRLRVILHLIEIDLGKVEDQAQAELLHSLDLILSKRLTPAGFLWGPELQPAFPLETYWYLYGHLS